MIVTERMTMTKCVRWCVVGLIAWAWPCGVAHAAQADWWDRLSGPGPFGGISEEIRFVCVSQVDEEQVVTWLKPWDPASNATAQFFSLFRHSTFPPAPRGEDPQSRAKQNCLLDSNIRSFASVTPSWQFAYDNDVFEVEDDDGTLEPGRVFMFPIVGAYTVRPLPRLDLSTGFGIAILEGSGFNTFARPIWAPLTVSFIVKRQVLKVSASINRLLYFSNDDFCTGTAVCKSAGVAPEANEFIPHISLHFGF
jgi:hypothetical protein